MVSKSNLNIRALQVFETVSRNKSITTAANELGITQSAVSHQLKKLSNDLGRKLVLRSGRTLILTEYGENLARSLSAAFDIIHENIEHGYNDKEVIRVGSYSSLACSWLIPRIDTFNRLYPNVDLRLIMLYDPHKVSGRLADVFITSEAAASGYTNRRLFSERLEAVGPASGPEDFSSPMRLISAEAETGLVGRAWEAFALLNNLDLSVIRSGEWLCCSHYISALEMALAGLARRRFG